MNYAHPRCTLRVQTTIDATRHLIVMHGVMNVRSDRGQM
jgi:hypothetical protein